MNNAVKIEDYHVARLVGDLDEVIRRSGYKFDELKVGKGARVTQARFRCYRDMVNMGFTKVAVAELFGTSYSVVNYGIRRCDEIEKWEKKVFVRGTGRKDSK